MQRLELFNEALELTNKKMEEYPQFFVLEPIKTQLLYLINIEEGKETDLSKLEHMTIGRITAYDIDNFDPKLAEKLYKVCAEMRSMQWKYLGKKE